MYQEPIKGEGASNYVDHVSSVAIIMTACHKSVQAGAC